ncbi:ABC transporter ATP-binding protein [Nakamurella sp. A5-74]|uniref:ABC transporter ATP-binding protein n=1 Tax=Nakamurella sp. A5-74 TaxID=3158264 RepID=A0AAU8DPS7_9ACTN
MSTLTFREVTVDFGPTRAVDRVDLEIADGSVVGLVGESGSGKSTLARVAVGLQSCSGGEVLLDGSPLRRHRAGRPGSVQLVFQDPYSSLDPRMSVGEAISEGLCGVRGRRARDAEVRRLLDLVSLPADRASALPAEMSGGQRQRVALARALGAQPSVLIADEITSALDVSVQGAVLNLVKELRVELGLTMLSISHNLAVVRYVSDEIVVMQGGRVVEAAAAATLLGAPQQEYTRELLAAAPRLGERIDAVPRSPSGSAAGLATDLSTTRPTDPRPTPMEK